MCDVPAVRVSWISVLQYIFYSSTRETTLGKYAAMSAVQGGPEFVQSLTQKWRFLFHRYDMTLHYALLYFEHIKACEHDAFLVELFRDTTKLL